MKFSLLLFQRLILRPLWREPVRTALTILAIALGVGVVVAIDLAGQAAAGSFHSSLESLTGKADLVITGLCSFPTLSTLLRASKISPRLEGKAKRFRLSALM